MQKLDQLTQEKWDALSGKAKWDSIVALRGPDLAWPDHVKWVTTAVIRYRLSKVMRVGGMVNNLPFVILPLPATTKPDKSNFSWSHFLGHVAEAADWLEIPIERVPWEIFEKLAKPNGEGLAGLIPQMVPYLSEEARDFLKKTYIGYYGGAPCA